MLHIFIAGGGDDIRPGATGKPRARLPGGDPRAGRRRARPRRRGAARRDRAGRLPLPGRRPPGELRRRRVERHRRRVLPGRGRLLLLPGPQRQHDRLLGLQHRRPRGRGGHRHAPRRRRSRPWWAGRTPSAAPSSAPSSCSRTACVGDAAEAKEIQDYVKQQLAPYKYPRDVRFTDALPRNASGKLQHFALRAQVEAEAQRGRERKGLTESDEDRRRRRRPGRAVLRRPDEAARPGPRGHRLGAQRRRRHVRLRRRVLRRDPRRHRERRHRRLRPAWRAGSPAGPTSTSSSTAPRSRSAARASPR